jgi:hypothetical protein
VNKPTLSKELEDALPFAIDENGVCEDALPENLRKEYMEYRRYMESYIYEQEYEDYLEAAEQAAHFNW